MAREEIEALRRSLAGAASDLRGLQQTLSARQRELDQLRGSLSAALGTLREQLQRVEGSAAWRYGHRATRSLSRVRGRRITTAGGVNAAIGQVDRALELLGVTAAAERTGQSGPAAPAPPRSGRPGTHGDQVLLGRRIRDALGPAPPAGDPPIPVAAVVVSNSGERTRAVLERLSEARYPALEVVLIDNASPDGEVSGAVDPGGGVSGTVDADRGTPGPAPARVTVDRLPARASFAQACNRGAELAGAQLLLFINDDIAPVEPDWLDELVSSLRDGEAAVAGGTLLDPVVDDLGAVAASGWRVEQRGISIGTDDDAFTPVRRDAGEDVFGERFGIDVPSVAVSAACLLIDRANFEALGGFDTGYQYGLEDIDLCLRARARGQRVVCCGRALLVHEGSTAQQGAGREFRRVNRAVNRRRLRHLWGPELWRGRLDGRLLGDPAWGPGVHLAIARTSNDPDDGWGDHQTARELGEAAQALGWRVSYLALKGDRASEIPDDIDLAVVLTDGWDVRMFPAGAVLCAWIRNWTERWLERPWLHRYDLLLASSDRSAQLLRSATGYPVVPFPLASNPLRFHPPRPGVTRDLDWVFTGNRWGDPRAIEPALTAGSGQAAAIYGRGWEKVAGMRELARGPLAYEELPDAYGAAKLVLDDTAEPTLAYDAVNARVFDALACGALVLTNCERGVHELFDDEFPTWSSPAQARTELDRLLAAPGRRVELAERYRRTVLAHHTYEHRARQLRRLTRELAARRSFCLKIGAPDAEQALRWGDLHFAEAFGRALRRLGHRWRVDILPDWDAPAGSNYDVAVHIRGRSEYKPVPGQCNVLWLISHPETLEDDTLAGYDLICVASATFAAALRERTSVPVRVLDQATDPRIFFPERDPRLAHELVFVGNSRGVRRKILDDVATTRRDLAVWGAGWEGSPVARHLRGEHIPNAELRRVYSSAAIVLCDHWPDMRAAGFRSNRLYDALACGALVVSDRVAGLDGAFGDAVVTYSEPAELAALLDRLVDDPAERARRVAGARELVLAGETFDHRARELTGWVEAALG